MAGKGLCPGCPGPRVPHHCGLAQVVQAEDGCGRGRGRGGRSSEGSGGKGYGGASSSGKRKGGRGSGLRSDLSHHRGPFPVMAEGVEVGGFSLRAHLLGRGGENVRHISEQTGVRIVLEGPGLEAPSGAGDAPAAMASRPQVRIIGRPGADLEAAEKLLQDLLDQVRNDFQQWLARAGSVRACGSGVSEQPPPPAPHPAQREPRRERREGQGARGGKRAEVMVAAEACKAEAMRLGEEVQQLKEKERHLRQEAAEKRRLVASVELPKSINDDFWQRTGLGNQAVAACTAAKALRQGSKLGEVSEETRARALESAQAFWDALDAKRSEGGLKVVTPEAEVAAETAKVEAREAGKAASEIAYELAKKARAASKASQQAEMLIAASTATTSGGSGQGRVDGFCALFPMGACPFKGQGEGACCPRGRHSEPPKPAEDDVLVRVSRAKTRLLQQKWTDAGGRGELAGAWQIRNPRLEVLFRASECDFAEALGHGSDVIDGWHGTPDANVLPIAVNGFDPKRRCGQVFGAGEYFAKDPNVSIGYARGGAFMFLCKLLLGQEGLDHDWVNQTKYYILKQRNCRIQALPLYLVQFRPSSEALAMRLLSLPEKGSAEPVALAVRQRGGMQACEARRDAGMVAGSTRHLWLGWLSPDLCRRNDEVVEEDVKQFFKGHAVAQVIPERNGARIGAFVLLVEPIGRSAFEVLRKRLYRGQFQISVDDQQPANPRCAGKVCPRFTGPSRYCRGWNIRGHHAWQWGCPFEHPEESRATHGAQYSLDVVPRGSAKFDEIQSDLTRSAPFFSADGSCGMPRIVGVRRVINARLEALYEERRGFLHDKHGFAVEKELWHGTSCKALPELLTHGLQPPSDTQPAQACPRSGGRGLCTTLCSSSCAHCVEPHNWDRCHMYGLGVYLADLAQKSHRYVREPSIETSVADAATPLRTGTKGQQVFSMLRCRVCLGNPYLIEGNLLNGKAMHDFCWCQDPSDMLESSEEWSVARGHDTFFVRGLSGAQKTGLGVFNNEYIVFQPYQVLPLYRVDYVLQ